MECDAGDIPISNPTTTTDVDATNESNHNAYQSATPSVHQESMLNEDREKNREAIEDELCDKMESLCSQLSDQGSIGITDEAQSKLSGTKAASDDAKNDEEKKGERYECLLKEFAERELKLQMQIDDKNKEIKKLHAKLNEVSDRVVPSMPKRPELEHYVAVYDRNIVGKRRMRVTRAQLRVIKAYDKKMEKYNRHLDSNMPDSTRYGWLKNSEKLLQIKCPYPVDLWQNIRVEHPHIFYGLKFVNRSKTEFEFLDEEQLRKKYKEEPLIALGLVDEDDAVAMCLTPSDEARERVCGLVKYMIEENKLKVEAIQTECGEPVENESDE